MSEDKRSPFSEEFNLLGAVVDLTKAAAGSIAVHNKPSRIDDLKALVQSICESETVALSTLETLKGRLLYARDTHLDAARSLQFNLFPEYQEEIPWF